MNFTENNAEMFYFNIMYTELFPLDTQ